VNDNGGRTRDLPIDEEEANDLGLHVKMCGQRYNQLVDAINELRLDLAGNRKWHKAIFTTLVLAVIGSLLKSTGVLP